MSVRDHSSPILNVRRHEIGFPTWPKLRKVLFFQQWYHSHINSDLWNLLGSYQMTHHHRMAWSLQLSWTILILKFGRVVWWCKTWRKKIKAQLLTSLSFPLWQSPGPDIVRMAPHPPAVDTLAPPPQATGGRRLSILIFDPSEHHRPEFKVQDDSPGKLSLQMTFGSWNYDHCLHHCFVRASIF